MRGDLLFFHGTRWDERLVQWWTHGPYCHVAIDLGDGTAIAAQWQGVVRAPVTTPPVRRLVISQHASDAQITAGLTWLTGELRDGYDYAAIVDDVLPTWWPFAFQFRRRFDCSELGFAYLVACGLTRQVLRFVQLPQRITPNDLARALDGQLVPA